MMFSKYWVQEKMYNIVVNSALKAVVRLSSVFHLIGCIFFVVYISACTKLIEISPPNNTITTVQVFSDSSNAAAAISGIYSNILYGGGGYGFCNGAETILCGLSSDELVNFETGNIYITQFYYNTLQSTNGVPDLYFWSQPYTYIYQANACIEGLRNSSGLSKSAKDRFIGEAKFFRSLFYFYLVNLFGDVPYVTTTNWPQSDTARRINKNLIYLNIVDELKEAKGLLPADYSYSNGERTRVNRFAVSALLARVYLYLKDWKNAEQEAGSIINNSALYSLVADLKGVFLANSSESILQWQLNTSFGFYNNTPEGYSILPPDSTLPPAYYISSQLLNSFETGDQRKIAWLNRSHYDGDDFIYPFKYKLGQSQQIANANPTEYYMVLRLAEQFLIRAEARANISNLTGAISDVNVIRGRAGLEPLSNTLDKDQLLAAIMQERRVELFAEWGHRWFDLKRTGLIDDVMSQVNPSKNPSGSWQTNQQLYPISQGELSKNPYLKQNPGY